MATKPRSYKKGSYTYTESAPGSNKFQNFTAAKPTVKQARDESRDKKAAVVQTPSPKYRGGPEGDGKVVSSKASATPTSDYRSPRSRPSATPTSDYRAAPIKKSYPARQGGMDTGNVVQSSPPATTNERKYKRVPKSAVLAYGGDKPPVLLKYDERIAEKTNTLNKTPKGKAILDTLTLPYKPRTLPKAPKKRRSYLQRSREWGLIGGLFAD